MLVLYLSDEDWQDVLRFNSHRFLTFKLFFSEFIQAATQASEDIRYVMEENIEKIDAEKDLGDGSARMDSYQTLLDFGIWHSGDLLKHPIYCWAKFGGYEV